MAASFACSHEQWLIGSGLGACVVVDSDGVDCGIVADIELENVRGIELRARAVLIRVEIDRPLWARRLARIFGRGRILRVAWSEVRVCDRRVVLVSPASRYGLEASAHAKTL